MRASGPIILPSSMSQPEDRRRMGRPDRRVGKPDLRDRKVERRFHFTERREEPPIQPTSGTPLLASGDS
jgi:hypothetical protein